MHDNEVVATDRMVRRLLEGQFPEWASLPLSAVPPTGTDNIIFRLGSHLGVRLPRIESATPQIARDQRWLPLLAPRLPSPVTRPLAVGQPNDEYPFQWAVHEWLEGENPRPGDHPELAADLAAFVTALSRIDEGPTSSRAGPLSVRDEPVSQALTLLHGEVIVSQAADLWAESVSAPSHVGPPVWRHADLTSGNLLTAKGRLVGVIDWGPSGLGDPAVDLVPYWRVFRGESRKVFRDALDADDSAWARAKGWALSIALLELAYYRNRDRMLADAARVALRELLPAE